MIQIRLQIMNGLVILLLKRAKEGIYYKKETLSLEILCHWDWGKGLGERGVRREKGDGKKLTESKR